MKLIETTYYVVVLDDKNNTTYCKQYATWGHAFRRFEKLAREHSRVELIEAWENGRERILETTCPIESHVKHDNDEALADIVRMYFGI